MYCSSFYVHHRRMRVMMSNETRPDIISRIHQWT
ncbi:unnamed protein product [Haemonchus placei]|uniref:Uncharacterized protein n=1 Tax=Haemonchus placei TaxID=6290 RepID=A0A3P8BKV3_HAEPC|nr:unnamed protein product [Haemonchus placei]